MQVDLDAVERKLAAILSADVVGYSRLMADNELATVRMLAAYRDEIRLLVQQNRGRVVDSPGDNLLAEFPSARDATRCAVEIQRVLQARNADVPPDRKMEFRIGVHLGDVLVEGDRIYGEGVNMAARLEGLAEAGGICVSGTVYEQVRNKLSVGFEDLGDQTVKNIPYPVRVYRIRMKSEELAADKAMPGAGELTALGFSGRPDIAVLVIPAVWVFYAAIVFEVLFMSLPFALYYYSAYGPSLNLLHESAWTAWLTGFFLPHFSDTSSPVLNRLWGLSWALMLLGAVLFFVGFLQIYWAKIWRRELVTGGLYAVAQHPQYLGLAIVGLGTLLDWPRFLTLIMYITMLFLYGFLARWEEERCLQKFGESYRAYCHLLEEKDSVPLWRSMWS
jgi:class 3 adenylate cyclase/protein-S-isoprenylcysteine O-methyltransferase Ste14